MTLCKSLHREMLTLFVISVALCTCWLTAARRDLWSLQQGPSMCPSPGSNSNDRTHQSILMKERVNPRYL